MIRDVNIGNFIRAIGDGKDNLLESKYDDGSTVYSDDERLAIEKMSIELFKMYFPDGDYYFQAQYMEISWRGGLCFSARRLCMEGANCQAYATRAIGHSRQVIML